MADTLRMKYTYRRNQSGAAKIGEVVRAIAAEHTLALSAAAKAESPRRNVARVRAMYVPTPELTSDSDADF